MDRQWSLSALLFFFFVGAINAQVLQFPGGILVDGTQGSPAAQSSSGSCTLAAPSDFSSGVVLTVWMRPYSAIATGIASFVAQVNTCSGTSSASGVSLEININGGYRVSGPILADSSLLFNSDLQTWHHFYAVLSGSSNTATLYRDGVQIASQSGATYKSGNGFYVTLGGATAQTATMRIFSVANAPTAATAYAAGSADNAGSDYAKYRFMIPYNGYYPVGSIVSVNDGTIGASKVTNLTALSPAGYSFSPSGCSQGGCANGATCTEGVLPGGYSCACAIGFSGVNCQTNINECASAPCVNGGTCSDQANGFICACQAGFTGMRCQTNINECASNPCANGGTCIDGVNSYTCMCIGPRADAQCLACAPGYTGAACQTNINECASNPCQNGGTCLDGINSFTCSCTSSWRGTVCQSMTDCAPPCLNGGTCLDGGIGLCQCAPGWSGPRCSTNLNECASFPCLNGGTCTDNTNGYTCNCTSRYFGSYCQLDRDICDSSCLNGGTCSVSVNNTAVCSCVSGYFHSNCGCGDGSLMSDCLCTGIIPPSSSGFYHQTWTSPILTNWTTPCHVPFGQMEFHLWGAGGAGASVTAGGYTSSDVVGGAGAFVHHRLTNVVRDTSMLLYVGGGGRNHRFLSDGGFGFANGGCNAARYSFGYGGGGASEIQYPPGTRVIVAAGGGAGHNAAGAQGGSGGCLIGSPGAGPYIGWATGGTQTTGGTNPFDSNSIGGGPATGYGGGGGSFPVGVGDSGGGGGLCGGGSSSSYGAGGGSSTPANIECQSSIDGFRAPAQTNPFWVDGIAYGGAMDSSGGDGSITAVWDIDECLTGAFACPPRFVCNNTYGGYECVCPIGFTGSACSVSCADSNLMNSTDFCGSCDVSCGTNEVCCSGKCYSSVPEKTCDSTTKIVPCQTQNATHLCGEKATGCFLYANDITGVVSNALVNCTCQSGYEQPLNLFHCGYEFEAEACNNSPLIVGAAISQTCGIFTSHSSRWCPTNSTKDASLCTVHCHCKPGTGTVPGSNLQCSGHDVPCEPDEGPTYCGFGQTCMKRCDYGAGSQFPLGCVVLPESCTASTIVEYTYTHDITAPFCSMTYVGGVLQLTQCDCGVGYTGSVGVGYTRGDCRIYGLVAGPDSPCTGGYVFNPSPSFLWVCVCQGGYFDGTDCSYPYIFDCPALSDPTSMHVSSCNGATFPPSWRCQTTGSGYWSGLYCTLWNSYPTANSNTTQSVGYQFQLSTTNGSYTTTTVGPQNICNPGFTGFQCQFLSCPSATSQPCSGHGACSNGVCACSAGWTGCGCQYDQYALCTANGDSCTTNLDPTGTGCLTCSQQGSCNSIYSNGLPSYACSCNATFTGGMCQTSKCPNNCNSGVSGQSLCSTSSPGNLTNPVCACQSSGTCTSSSSGLYAGADCGTNVCSSCGWSPGLRQGYAASIAGSTTFYVCNGHGTCNSGSCVCDSGYSGPYCQNTPCTGTCSPLPSNTYCVPPPTNTCPCLAGYGGTPCVSLCGTNALPVPNAAGTDYYCQCINGTAFDNSTCKSTDATQKAGCCLNPVCPVDPNGVTCGGIVPALSNSANPYCGTGGACVCISYFQSPSLYAFTSTSAGYCLPYCNPLATTTMLVTPTTSRTPCNVIAGTTLPLHGECGSCSCSLGYTAASRCYSTICLNGGTLTFPTSTTTQCICPPGWTGTTCNTAVCNGVGTLVNQVCSCPYPYLSSGTSCVSACLNGGTIANNACSCPFAWNGTTCQTSRCGSYGFPTSDGTGCTCNTYFSGTLCGLSRCLNGGNYSVLTSSCSCDADYVGPFCQFRKCGSTGHFNLDSGLCDCLGSALGRDPITGNCTLSLCGPFGSPSGLTCSCVSQSHAVTISLPYHPVGCEPNCTNGGHFNQTTLQCDCPSPFAQPFCLAPVVVPSSSAGPVHSSSGVAAPSFSSSTGSAQSSTGELSADATTIAPTTVVSTKTAIGQVTISAAALSAINTILVALSVLL